MDCAKLKSDIEKLKQVKTELEETLEADFFGRSTLEKQKEKAEFFEEDALSTHLVSFAEKNAEFFDAYELGEPIPGCPRGKISVISQLSNGDILVGTADGKLKVLREQNGEYVFGESIKGLEDAGHRAGSIGTIVELSEKDALVGGFHGAKILHNSETGGYSLSENYIDGAARDFLYSACKLEDDSVMVIGGDSLYRLENRNGQYILLTYNGNVAGTGSWASKKLSDGSVVVAGMDNANIRRSQKGDEFNFGEEIDLGIEAPGASSEAVSAIEEDLNGNLLLGDINGNLWIAERTNGEFTGDAKNIFHKSSSSTVRKIVVVPESGDIVLTMPDGVVVLPVSQDGVYDLNEIIHIKRVDSNYETEALLPNGDILVGGDGEVRAMSSSSKPTMDKLRKNLRNIARKRNSF